MLAIVDKIIILCGTKKGSEAAHKGVRRRVLSAKCLISEKCSESDAPLLGAFQVLNLKKC